MTARCALTEKKNAINTIFKRYPHLTPFYKCNASGDGQDVVEKVSVGNISFGDFSSAGEIECGLIREIASGVPRPYSVNSLTLIYDGISFTRLLPLGQRTIFAR